LKACSSTESDAHVGKVPSLSKVPLSSSEKKDSTARAPRTVCCSMMPVADPLGKLRTRLTSFLIAIRRARSLAEIGMHAEHARLGAPPIGLGDPQANAGEQHNRIDRVISNWHCVTRAQSIHTECTTDGEVAMIADDGDVAVTSQDAVVAVTAVAAVAKP
jgi:hypothetical protein